MLLSLVKYINLKHILGLVALLGLVFSHYSVYQKGVTTERIVQEAKFVQLERRAITQQTELLDKILILQEDISIYTSEVKAQQENLVSSFNTIKKRAQGTVVYNMPECKITDEYLQIYKDAVKAANAKN